MYHKMKSLDLNILLVSKFYKIQNQRLSIDPLGKWYKTLMLQVRIGLLSK